MLFLITEALSACHYIPEVRSNVFNILYHALNSENAELQQASHECMKRVSSIVGFLVGFLCRLTVEMSHSDQSCHIRKSSEMKSSQ